MTKIDVFGSCVVRDVFRFDSHGRYDICITQGRQSVPTLFSKPFYFDADKIEWRNISNYEKKMLLDNMNKFALDLLQHSKGEWLILDLAEDRHNLCEIATHSGKSTMCHTAIMKQVQKEMIDYKIVEEKDIRIIEFDQLPWEEVERSYKQFVEVILKKYSEDKIIIVELQEAEKVVKTNLEIVNYPAATRKRENIYFKKIYKLIKGLLPKANYIRMPENTLMCENHLWGILPLHFQESYYRYVLEAIDNIIGNQKTYSLQQLLNIQNQKNLLFLNATNKQLEINVKEIDKAISDVKEYRKEITNLQNQLQEIQLDYAKMKIKNQEPSGKIDNSIIQVEPSLCTGCSACHNACPIDAIVMSENSEGFISPEVDRSKCRNCGYCANVCPILNVRFRNSEKKVCLAVMADDEMRKISSSGGVFPILAKYVLGKGGYVCGAAWNEKWEVEHKIIHDMSELPMLQGSKYIQSNINRIYKTIEKLLKSDQYVLFSGTPCQVDGLNHFLGKEYHKLVTMDILCHGVPSQKAFKSYLETKYKNRKIKHILFRDKQVNGWGAYTTIQFEDGDCLHMNMQNCMWIMAYLKFILNRESCYRCIYTKTRRVGDFTVGDFWGIEKYYPNYNDGKGTSVLTLNNEKAIAIYNEINSQLKLKEWMPIEYSIPGNSTWIKNTIEPERRKLFLEYLKTENYCDALEDTLYNGKVFDIGIVGWWYYYNYGSILTYYALNRALVRMGYSVLMIHHTNNGARMSSLTNAFPENFIKKYCSISHFYTDEDVHLLNRRCKAFVSGSDQLWNPNCEDAAGKEFFLDFVDDKHLKLSYASSLGNAVTASSEFINKYAPLAQRFAGISVREKTGIQGCKTIYDVEGVKVCDPVFLCEKEEFEKLAYDSNIQLQNKKYLLSFILDPDENKRRIIVEKAAELGVEYINLLDLTDANEKAKQLGLENTKPFASVEDFMNYFMNASYIITDSFHGTCFSIIFDKEFISIANYVRGEKRVTELLDWLEIKGRIMYDSSLSINEFKTEKINYEIVHNKILNARNFAKDWLEFYLKDTLRGGVV